MHHHRSPNNDDQSQDDDNATDDYMEYAWESPTILHVVGAVDERITKRINAYIDKKSDRVLTPSLALESEDSYEFVQDTVHRKCLVAASTGTLSKLCDRMDAAIEEAVDVFVDKYDLFNMTSKSDTTILQFNEGDFYAEHAECTTSNSDDGARRLTAYIGIDGNAAISFAYQGLSTVLKPGNILMFPSCPLHPVSIPPLTEGQLRYATVHFM